MVVTEAPPVTRSAAATRRNVEESVAGEEQAAASVEISSGVNTAELKNGWGELRTLVRNLVLFWQGSISASLTWKNRYETMIALPKVCCWRIDAIVSSVCLMTATTTTSIKQSQRSLTALKELLSAAPNAIEIDDARYFFRYLPNSAPLTQFGRYYFHHHTV